MGFLDGAKKFGGAALDKGKDLAQITKLNAEIISLESKVSESKLTIGNIIVEKEVEVSNREVKAELKKIAEYNKEIEEKKSAIEELKNKTKA